MPNQAQVIIAAVLATLLITIGSSLYFYHEGKVTANAKLIVAQLNHNKKVDKDYAKIDKATPFNTDKQSAANWLLKHTRK